MTEDTEPERLPDDHVEDPEDFFSSNEEKEATFQHKGQEVRIKFKEITRGMKYQAMEKAALAYMEKFPDADEPRPLPSVLERELVVQSLTWWNLPRHYTVGWEMLQDDQLADKIMERIGVRDVIGSMDESNDEVSKAKNSTKAGTRAA